MRTLITGGAGQLASDLAALLGDDARAYTHEELDICDERALTRAYEDADPELVINCAALHNLDACEREPARAWEVNVEAVRGLARRRLPLVHVSTNYVFDGRRAEPYGEQDLPVPRSVYALSKLAGEHAALAYAERALVVRTAGLYGLHGSASKGGNFVQRILARAREGGALRVVADQRLQPTFTGDLAAAIPEALRAGGQGVVHLTASGSCSWYEFTQAIMEAAGVEASVEAVATTVGQGGVDRPLNGVLVRPRADELGLAPLRPWREALSDYITQRRPRGPRCVTEERSYMQRLESRLDGPILIAPRVIGDERGFFCETYRRSVYAKLGIAEGMVQDNHSRSGKGIVRGMHFQIGAGAAKLVGCGRGEIFDVVVDLRRGSPTFGQWEGVRLNDENMRTFYCPIGFAHGFCVLSDVADVLYKQSNYYAHETERGIAYDDPDVGIEWPVPTEQLIASERDSNAPRLAEIADSLPFRFGSS